MNRETMTDEEARTLLHPLAGDPPGPSRVDVPRAMAEGRRRRRSRIWATVAAVGALTATSVAGGTLAVGAMGHDDVVPRPVLSTPTSAPASASAPAAPVEKGPADCTVTRLPTDGVTKAIVSGGDPSGRYLLGRLYTGRSPYPQVIWKDGRIAARPPLPGADGSFEDINTAGVAVGSAFQGEEIQGYAYHDGKVTAMKGGRGQASAINDAGVVVGGLGDYLELAAARWDSVDAQPVKLPVPDGTRESHAVDIDENGTILGTLNGPDRAAPQTGYLWQADGTSELMPLPVVDGVQADAFWPESIRNGWVAGRSVKDSADGSRSFAWFRYRVATGTYEELPDETGMPDRVAANGWVLGTVTEPRILSEAGVTKLPRYRKGTEYQLRSFSDDGLVVGGHMTGIGASTENQPLMWRCKLKS
jgi:hypothetical protein